MAKMPTSNGSNEITILGQRIILKTSHDNPDKVREVLDLVAEKISRVESRLQTRNTAPHQVALLALLELAEEYLDASERTQDLKQKLSEKSQRLIQLLKADFRPVSSANAASGASAADHVTEARHPSKPGGLPEALTPSADQ